MIRDWLEYIAICALVCGALFIGLALMPREVFAGECVRASVRAHPFVGVSPWGRSGEMGPASQGLDCRDCRRSDAVFASNYSRRTAISAYGKDRSLGELRGGRQLSSRTVTSTFSRLVAHIVAISAKKQVCGIGAQPIVASVANQKRSLPLVPWYRPEGQKVGEAVSRYLLGTQVDLNRKSAISNRRWFVGPRPAFIIAGTDPLTFKASDDALVIRARWQLVHIHSSQYHAENEP